MPRILITAFEPYDIYRENASWLTLVEFTKDLPAGAEITTRLYPVDFREVQSRLEQDLRAGYDVALHLGQAPGAASIQLEAIGLNVGGPRGDSPEELAALVEEGPIAYRSRLPLSQWAESLRREGIPARVSYHAGTYLCNATLYLTHYLAEGRQLDTQAAFVHLPLATSQVLDGKERASLPSGVAARALRLIVQALVTPAPSRDPKLA